MRRQIIYSPNNQCLILVITLFPAMKIYPDIYNRLDLPQHKFYIQLRIVLTSNSSIFTTLSG